MTETKLRMFISFDYDNDKALKDFLVGLSKNTDSPFEISDWSMKEAAPEEYWEKEAERRISCSDMVIVMVGPKTYNAPGVLKEVRITRRLDKPIYQIIGYKDGEAVPQLLLPLKISLLFGFEALFAFLFLPILDC